MPEDLFATLQTTKGDITVKLLPDHAPKTVQNFVGLAEGTKEWTDEQTGQQKSGARFYDGLGFHRVIDGFMIQGGCPLGTGTGAPGVHLRRRDPPGPAVRPALPAGDGQRRHPGRPRHERLAVLHLRDADAAPEPQAHDLRRGRRRRSPGRSSTRSPPRRTAPGDRPLEPVVITHGPHRAPPRLRHAGVTDRVCYRHPERPAGVSCQRCDRPICPDCMNSAAVGFQCPECFAAGVRSIPKTRTTLGGVARDNHQVVTLTPAGRQHAGLARGAGRWRPGLTPLVMYGPLVDTEPWRLITSAFTHEQFFHSSRTFSCSTSSVRSLERMLGRLRFTILYLASGARRLARGLLLDPNQPTLGASGAVLGLVGAFLVISRSLGHDVTWILGYIGLTAFLSFAVPNISWQGHLGGFVVGAAIGYLYVHQSQVAGLPAAVALQGPSYQRGLRPDRATSWSRARGRGIDRCLEDARPALRPRLDIAELPLGHRVLDPLVKSARPWPGPSRARPGPGASARRSRRAASSRSTRCTVAPGSPMVHSGRDPVAAAASAAQRVITEHVAVVPVADLCEGLAAHQVRRPPVLSGHVVDQVPNGPLGARCRRVPAVRRYRVDRRGEGVDAGRDEVEDVRLCSHGFHCAKGASTRRPRRTTVVSRRVRRPTTRCPEGADDWEGVHCRTIW